MKNREEAVVALGMFDGMHLGHRALIRRTVDNAAQLHVLPAVCTFSNHPMEVLGGQTRLLSTPEEREMILRGLGAEDVWMTPFTKNLSLMSPVTFIEMLMDKWKLAGIVVGFNYTFGDHGRGTPSTLAELGKTYGFMVDVVQPVLFMGEPVSSTRIRNALEAGKVQMAEKMLLHPYAMSGIVIENKRIGRRIGFPTANIAISDNRVIPACGVYATDAAVDGKQYRAVTNIGTNPTVGGAHLTVETHLIDFEGNLYGRTLAISFLEYLRGEKRFDSMDLLKMQIVSDVDRARKIVVCNNI
ncbi:MAG: bifunctional riboflavin kinase/FAD synthetase [Clostridia bacterium]